MSATLIDPQYGEQEFAAEVAALIESGLISVPENPEAPAGPTLVDETDFFDDGSSLQMSQVDALEWELWAGVEQDEAERLLLELKAPAWVFLPPGGELAAALEQVRPQTESPIALIELMKATARLTAWSEAIRMSAIASFYRQRQAQATEIPRPSEVDSHGRPIDPERSWVAEIAAALKIGPETASGHVDTALRLTSVLRATHAALRCGAISLSKAIAINDATRTLTVEQARAVEAHVLKRAPSQSHANLRRSLRKQVAYYDAKNEADRHREARAEREVRLVPLPDGMAGLWIVHTADKVQQMWIVIQAMADLAKRPVPVPAPSAGAGAAADDGTAAADPAPTGDADVNLVARPPQRRSAGQRRADVAAELFEFMLWNGLDWLGRRLPDQHRRRPHIEVLTPASTLLGLDDEPCELTGYGPVPAEMARHIAADGTWRRILTDPANGSVLEASTTRHDPGALVSETLLAAHPVCDWINCNRPARECDRDHGTPFARTGTTNLADLRTYCELHHIIKDTPVWGWTATNNPDGFTTLTTPTGHRYTTIPARPGPTIHHPAQTNADSPGTDPPGSVEPDDEPPPF
jgi:hypothetical protein